MTSLSIGVKRAHRVLVDEAAQSTEATSLVPLLLGCRQAVFIGDEKHGTCKDTLRNTSSYAAAAVIQFIQIFRERVTRRRRRASHLSDIRV
jgi:hypothetical protein